MLYIHIHMHVYVHIDVCVQLYMYMGIHRYIYRYACHASLVHVMSNPHISGLVHSDMFDKHRRWHKIMDLMACASGFSLDASMRTCRTGQMHKP